MSQDSGTGVSEGAPSALSASQWPVLFRCQDFWEKDRKGARCWHSGERLEKELSLFSDWCGVERCVTLWSVPKWSKSQGPAQENASSPSRRALWPELGEGSSIRPEGVGGRSELLKLEGQIENQIKKKCADTVCLAVWASCNRTAAWRALCGWQPPLFSPRLLLPAGWWASLILMWHVAIHRASPQAWGRATLPSYGTAPRPSTDSCRAGLAGAEPGGHSAPDH